MINNISLLSCLDALRQYAINNNINSLGVGYDYNSIMHYNDNFFSNGRGPTMVSIPSGIVLGRALRLSPLDIKQTNLLYQCGEYTNFIYTECKLLRAALYYWHTATRNPGPPLVPLPPPEPTSPPPTLPYPSCGQILTATSGTITSPGYPTYRHNQDCAWIIAISNSRGYRMRITFQPVSVEHRYSHKGWYGLKC